MPETTKTPRSKQRSEIAEVRWEPATREKQGRILGKRQQTVSGQYVFFALAVGPMGRYVARRSPAFAGSMWKRRLSQYRWASGLNWASPAEKAFNDLVAQLWQDGWEPVGSGKEWFEYKFKRAVTAENTARDADGTVELQELDEPEGD